MAELTYREAVAAGIAQEMRRDENVVFLGEDIADAGGVFSSNVNERSSNTVNTTGTILPACVDVFSL